MVSLPSHLSMHLHSLLFDRRTAPIAALKMLSSSSSSTTSSSSTSSPNPNPSLTIFRRPTSETPLYPNPSLTIFRRPTSETPSKSPKFPLLSDSSQALFTSQILSLSKSFAASSMSTGPNGGVTAEGVECPLVVVSFYKFADFPDHADLRKPLKDLCQRLYVSGGIILAPEGINGSICGTRNAVEEVLNFIQADDRLKGLRRIESPVSPEEEAIHHGHMSSSPLAAGEDAPFRWDHVRVKLKKEIVTLGMPSVSPIERVGEYVSPKEWNELISDPDTVVIDVRNDYETRIGKFKRAVDPCTAAFREFPSWVDETLKPNEPDGGAGPAGSTQTTDEQNEETEKKTSRVAMYCTGGIRCEKASSFLLSRGFKEVYHLQGGILKYLEEVPKDESLWEGECFVFDKRVSVDHGLVQGTYKLCYGCKQPVSDADMEAAEWEDGVCCPYCYSSKSEEEKERARARQRQFERWGIIGGPDKGRKPIKTREGEERNTKQMSSSI